jgi:uncharacterized protein YjbI with pentapeptide repeats
MVLGFILAAVVSQPPGFCMGCSFAGSDLTGNDFANVLYVGANFAGSVLARASFRNAKLIAANFKGADLNGASLDGVQCTACNFSGAKLDDATFGGAQIVAANFTGADLPQSNDALRALFAGCYVCGFQNASLAGRDLSTATLVGLDFSQADARGTKFDGSTLCWYELDGGVRTPKCVTLSGARVEGASFKNVRICDDPRQALGCSAATADLLRRGTGSDLTGATLP